MMIQLKSFTKDAASRTKGLQLKTKLEHAIKEERNIFTPFFDILTFQIHPLPTEEGDFS